MKKKRILFFYTSFSSFVQTDYEILSEKYKIIKYKFVNSKNFFSMLWEFIKQILFLFGNLFTFDIVYCWFADYHTILPVFMAKLFKKKSFVVLGGYDVTYVEKINYGSFNNPIRAFCASYTMKQANLNLPVCNNIRSEALERVPAAKTKLLYTGYDSSKFVPEYNKDSVVLTVSIVDTYKRYEIKNVDFFLSVVETMPGIKFVAIGIEKRFIKGNIPENLIIIERIPQEEVLEYYQKASVYVHFSLREGLPNSVCEAMLCGCIPVGSNKGGIPTAIGDCGYILDSLDLKKAKENIEEALESSLEQRKAARQRIIENFSLDRRERNLSKLLKYYD